MGQKKSYVWDISNWLWCLVSRVFNKDRHPAISCRVVQTKSPVQILFHKINRKNKNIGLKSYSGYRSNSYEIVTNALFGRLLWRLRYTDRFFVTNEHKKTICDYFTGPKKRKIGTALSWRKTQSSFIVDCCESSYLPRLNH